jgi:hypothetical protein
VKATNTEHEAGWDDGSRLGGYNRPKEALDGRTAKAPHQSRHQEEGSHGGRNLFATARLQPAPWRTGAKDDIMILIADTTNMHEGVKVAQEFFPKQQEMGLHRAAATSRTATTTATNGGYRLRFNFITQFDMCCNILADLGVFYRQELYMHGRD